LEIWSEKKGARETGEDQDEKYPGHGGEKGALAKFAAVAIIVAASVAKISPYICLVLNPPRPN